MDSMGDRVRILLIDDHTLFRESLARLLEMEPEFEVVGRCATVAEGHHALVAMAVDVVLLDYDLGNEVGTDLLEKLDGSESKARVILVTAGMRATSTLNAVDAGVAGIVLKHSDPRYLIEAIRRVAAGETWWDTGVLRTAAASANNSAASVRSLTDRQRQVLRSILDGLSNKEIAARMESSETAIKATIQELFNKAGVRTRSQLVRVAIERYSVDWLNDKQAERA
jgi:two-component system, NarL family, nitrate/nitrite response regulator NarL